MVYISAEIRRDLLASEGRAQTATYCQAYIKSQLGSDGGIVVYPGAGYDVSNPMAFTGMKRYIFISTGLGMPEEASDNKHYYAANPVTCRGRMYAFAKSLESLKMLFDAQFGGDLGGKTGPTPLPGADGNPRWDLPCCYTKFDLAMQIRSDELEPVLLEYLYATYQQVVQNPEIMQTVLGGVAFDVLFSKASFETAPLNRHLLSFMREGGFYITDFPKEGQFADRAADPFRYEGVTREVFGPWTYTRFGILEPEARQMIGSVERVREATKLYIYKKVRR